MVPGRFVASHLVNGYPFRGNWGQYIFSLGVIGDSIYFSPTSAWPPPAAAGEKYILSPVYREASGPLRWLWLTWRHRRRLGARRKFAEGASIKSLLQMAKVPLSIEEKLKLLDEPLPPQEGK